jgi:hypothetical protein
MARLDKNGGVLCAIHNHHDHFEDFADERIKQAASPDWTVRNAISASLARFSATMICNDCNVAEPYAKNIADAPENFSFAPYEIASFIHVEQSKAHKIDEGRVITIYESARPTMRLLHMRLNAILRASLSGTDEMEPLARPAFRVMERLREQMKEKG